MPRIRAHSIAILSALLLIPMPVVAQDSHDIEFHALFPGQPTGDGLDCTSGEAVYDPLRAGQTLQLKDNTGSVVGFGVLEDVSPPSREGMCESMVTFIEVPDAPVYFVLSGEKALTSRERAELEASGWVMTSTFGTAASSDNSSAPGAQTRSPVTDDSYALTGLFWLLQCDGCGSTNFYIPSESIKGCYGVGGYSDIAPGMQIAVSDETNTLVGVGSLGEGTMSINFPKGPGCYFEWTVEGLPHASFYQLSAGRRGSVTYSFEELDANDWTVELSIGG